MMLSRGFGHLVGHGGVTGAHHHLDASVEHLFVKAHGLRALTVEAEVGNEVFHGGRPSLRVG